MGVSGHAKRSNRGSLGTSSAVLFEGDPKKAMKTEKVAVIGSYAQIRKPEGYEHFNEIGVGDRMVSKDTACSFRVLTVQIKSGR